MIKSKKNPGKYHKIIFFCAEIMYLECIKCMKLSSKGVKDKTIHAVKNDSSFVMWQSFWSCPGSKTRSYISDGFTYFTRQFHYLPSPFTVKMSSCTFLALLDLVFQDVVGYYGCSEKFLGKHFEDVSRKRKPCIPVLV